MPDVPLWADLPKEIQADLKKLRLDPPTQAAAPGSNPQRKTAAGWLDDQASDIRLTLLNL